MIFYYGQKFELHAWLEIGYLLKSFGFIGWYQACFVKVVVVYFR